MFLIKQDSLLNFLKPEFDSKNVHTISWFLSSIIDTGHISKKTTVKEIKYHYHTLVIILARLCRLSYLRKCSVAHIKK